MGTSGLQADRMQNKDKQSLHTAALKLYNTFIKEQASEQTLFLSVYLLLLKEHKQK